MVTVKRIHVLKSTVENFSAIISAKMSFQLRENDRDFQNDDLLFLKEIDENSCYTGRTQVAYVNHIVSGGAISESYVLLNMKLLSLAIIEGVRYATTK